MSSLAACRQIGVRLLVLFVVVTHLLEGREGEGVDVARVCNAVEDLLDPRVLAEAPQLWRVARGVVCACVGVHC